MTYPDAASESPCPACGDRDIKSVVDRLYGPGNIHVDVMQCGRCGRWLVDEYDGLEHSLYPSVYPTLWEAREEARYVLEIMEMDP